MKQSVRQMIECHWSARRIQRYLDADPSAPLTPDEVVRLEGHLATCEKCTQVTEEHRALRRALSIWPGAAEPDIESVRRLRRYVEELPTERE